MAKLLDEIHPGEILLEDFMKPLEITVRKLAADDVSPSRLSASASWCTANDRSPPTLHSALVSSSGWSRASG